MVTGRFAPSPSGRMHLGNVYAALLSFLSAKSQGGKWILRIEDLDKERCKSEYTKILLDDLHWLGLEWDQGPQGQDEQAREKDWIYFQSKRESFYQKTLKILSDQGLVYECWCRRSDLLSASAPHACDGTPLYSGKCRNLSEREKTELRAVRPPALRLMAPSEEDSFMDGHYGLQRGSPALSTGDCILRRFDGNFSYQLAVSCDDALMGVNEVVRGRDLLSSTFIQRFILSKLGYESPRYFHIPLLTDSTGRRLSKRDKDLDMGLLRENFSREQLLGKILFWCNMIDKEVSLSLEDALSLYNPNLLPRKDIVVK